MKHCKKLFALLAAALLCMALTLPAGAAAPLVRDECGVFDADTLADLEEQAESASDGHDVDVYFLVVDDIGDADQRDYAKNYYISNGLGYGDEQSGILFLLAVGSRKYVTITYGEGVTAFTDYRIEQQEDEIVPQLSDEEWADAAYTYIDMCDDALDYYADHGEPIDVDNDIGDADQRDYAKNYYISNGLGYGDEQSGILFLLAVGSRKYVTITYGEGVTAFTDYRIEQQEDEIVPQLSDEEWADAAYTYIDMCDDALDYYADHGEPIDVDNDIGLEDLLIAMIFPLGISAFICLILYHQMKTARKKTEADEYMPGFTLRVKRDRYTHTTRERTYDPPQKESNSSGGSSVDSDGFGGSSGGSF